MKFTDLDTTETRNESILIDLDGFTLNNGSKKVSLKGQWIKVYPTDSDTFTKAKLELQRKAVNGSEFDSNELIASLIESWSFDEKCTIENKIVAVKIWPSKLIDLIDTTASKRINFTVSKQNS